MKRSLVPVKNAPTSNNQIPGKEGLEKLLKQHFGYSEFRGKQLEAIGAVLSGRDCFCLMPTGGGKSMCYQIPALAKPGIVLVISPLIALMENQVTLLKRRGIPAEFLSSTQTMITKEKILEDLNSGKPSVRLLYVTPELVATFGFKTKLASLYGRGLLSLIAIDEAHCISTWGHDFRPSYRKLSSLRSQLPDVPLLALTATAVPKVQKDVIESLCLQHPLILRASFNRPNIFYEVRYKDLLDDAYTDLSNLLKSSGNVCSIVYCLERSTCDDLSNHLSKDGISSAAYHAGLNNKLRSTVLDDWLSSKIQVVVATVAFGYIHDIFVMYSIVIVLAEDIAECAYQMLSSILLKMQGIDRGDVRIVCHFNTPKSMEAFYQESGRAGRDQLPSRSVVYYGLDDRKKMEFILRNTASKKSQSSCSSDNLSEKSLADFTQMVEYCEGSGCRRKKVLESFGEQVSASFCRKSCDSCKHPSLLLTHLEELRCVPSISKKGGLPQIFTKSLDSTFDGQESEFWNRDDEACFSDEDISDSDDEVEAVCNLVRSKISSKAGLNEKFEVLKRAEELYYDKETQNKQDNGVVDKKAVTETLREACKTRLLNAMKQAQERLGKPLFESEACATFLEMECFKKYGKVGRTFYNSQLAATVRWLSSSSYEQIHGRLSANPVLASGQCALSSLPSVTAMPMPNPSDRGQIQAGATDEETRDDARFKGSNEPIQMEAPKEKMELPPIPSFSEFVNQKGNGGSANHLSESSQHSSAGAQKRTVDSDKHRREYAEKRMRR